jgi:large subunit ribosomal protein L29
MKPSKIREKTNQELTAMMEKMKRDIMDGKFKNTMSQLNDKSQLVKLRRDVARINTIIRERQ